MKLKNTLTFLACAGLTTGLAQAASIAVNFSENAANQTFTGGELIGPTGIDSSNWNNTASVGAGNLPSGSIAAGGIKNDSGVIVTGADLTWTSPNVFYPTGASQATDAGKLFTGYLDEGGSGSNGFTLSNFGLAQYDLYLFVAGDQGQAAGGTTSFLNDGYVVNGVNSGDFTALGFNGGTLVEAQGTVGGVAGNYIKFSNLTGNLTVASDNSGAGRSPINGFVVVAIPEPSSTALLGLGGLALILRRRK